MNEQEFLDKLKNGCVFASETLQFVEQYKSRIAFLERELELKEKYIQDLIRRYK